MAPTPLTIFTSDSAFSAPACAAPMCRTRRFAATLEAGTGRQKAGTAVRAQCGQNPPCCRATARARAARPCKAALLVNAIYSFVSRYPVIFSAGGPPPNNASGRSLQAAAPDAAASEKKKSEGFLADKKQPPTTALWGWQREKKQKKSTGKIADAPPRPASSNHLIGAPREKRPSSSGQGFRHVEKMAGLLRAEEDRHSAWSLRGAAHWKAPGDQGRSTGRFGLPRRPKIESRPHVTKGEGAQKSTALWGLISPRAVVVVEDWRYLPRRSILLAGKKNGRPWPHPGGRSERFRHPLCCRREAG